MDAAGGSAAVGGAQHGDALPAGRWDAQAQPGEKGLLPKTRVVRVGDAGPGELRVPAWRGDAVSTAHGQLALSAAVRAALLAYLARHLSR